MLFLLPPDFAEQGLKLLFAESLENAGLLLDAVCSDARRESVHRKERGKEQANVLSGRFYMNSHDGISLLNRLSFYRNFHGIAICAFHFDKLADEPLFHKFENLFKVDVL